jgi:hypothetical protein
LWGFTLVGFSIVKDKTEKGKISLRQLATMKFFAVLCLALAVLAVVVSGSPARRHKRQAGSDCSTCNEWRVAPVCAQKGNRTGTFLNPEQMECANCRYRSTGLYVKISDKPCQS